MRQVIEENYNIKKNKDIQQKKSVYFQEDFQDGVELSLCCVVFKFIQ